MIKDSKEFSKKTKYYLMPNQARNFIYADFEYNNKYIFIIEIELDSIYPSLSTYQKMKNLIYKKIFVKIL